MSVKKQTMRRLTALLRVIIEECEHNPGFEARVNSAFETTTSSRAQISGEPGETGHTREAALAGTKLGAAPRASSNRGRRAQALVDPIDTVALKGEPVLRNELSALDLEKLRDIVAQFAMDPGRLVMKWQNRERVINHIISVSLGRARKGDAFR